MTDIRYFESLAPEARILFERLSNDISFLTNKSITSVLSGKVALTIWAIAKRDIFKKCGGKFHNKQLLFDEAFRILTKKPLETAPRINCDHCQQPVDPNDQAISRDGTIVIHFDCDGEWEEANGVKFPYEHDEESEEEVDEEEEEVDEGPPPLVMDEVVEEEEVVVEEEVEEEPIKLNVKEWKTPWGIKVWRLAQGDTWHPDNHCWEIVKKEFFNFNTTPYVGKFNEAEQECDEISRPRNSEWKFITSS